MTAPRLIAMVPELLVQLALAAFAALLLVAVGQPILTDDAWWHLALGRAYASGGPWLAADPLLHTATGPPSPASWLADLALFGVERVTGFTGLRIAHALAVATILALAGSLLKRAAGWRAAGSLGVMVFGALAAYRLFQLRPHLVTILATLVLYRLLLEKDSPPSCSRVLTSVVLLALWANSHSGFLLGPILLGSAVGGLILAAPLRTDPQRARDFARARRLALALGLGLLATLANPDGAAGHLAYFTAGTDSPELAGVVDEWRRLDPFRLPRANLPPTPLCWLLIWGLLILTPVAAIRAALRWKGDGAAQRAPGPDPALLAVAGASMLGMLLAVRFLWLGIFPLLLLAAGGGPARATRGAAPVRVTAALAALLLLAGFMVLGSWTMTSRVLPRTWSGYARPYQTQKYHAHAAWMLEDAGLEGNLYNEYLLGGFLGFWGAPKRLGFVNGTLNVPTQAMNAYRALRERRGLDPGESFLELLDRYGVDIFLGVQLPQLPRRNRPWSYTTAHLEGAPGWVSVFRNLRSAVYLRRSPRNHANLERVAGYYERVGVAFDPERGFDVKRVIREKPGWAVAHGLVPVHFDRLASLAHHLSRAQRAQATEQLASLYAALGLYEQALRLDTGLLQRDPGALAPRRRLVWSLLRLRRPAEALASAGPLDRAPSGDELSHRIANAARRAAALDDEEELAALVARLPVFTRAEGARVAAGFVHPEVRAGHR